MLEGGMMEIDGKISKIDRQCFLIELGVGVVTKGLLKTFILMFVQK